MGSKSETTYTWFCDLCGGQVEITGKPFPSEGLNRFHGPDRPHRAGGLCRDTVDVCLDCTKKRPIADLVEFFANQPPF